MSENLRIYFQIEYRNEYAMILDGFLKAPPDMSCDVQKKLNVLT